MRIKCDYCGGFLEDTDKVCPNCGAPNDHLQRSADGVPKTIEELKAFCEAKHLPLEQMRFFIGENYKEPRAFGIYQDEQGQFVVYKNKSDGQRAVRYRGTDEAYAVNEIYQKMRSEIIQRKEAGKLQNKSRTSPTPTPQSPEPPKKKTWKRFIGLYIFLFIVVGVVCTMIFEPDTGYYNYDNTTYYYDTGSWYYWDDLENDWIHTNSVSSELTDNYGDYYTSYDYEDGYNYTDFSTTDYYADNRSSSSSDSDWDDDDDWDWDSSSSWSSSDTDWDDDW